MRGLERCFKYGIYCQRRMSVCTMKSWGKVVNTSLFEDFYNRNTALNGDTRCFLSVAKHPKPFYTLTGNSLGKYLNKIALIAQKPSALHTSCSISREDSEKTDVENFTHSSLQTNRTVLELDEVTELLNLENMKDIVVIKIPEKMCYVDYFIIATAMSGRHLATVAELTNKLYKSKRKDGQPFTVIEGKRISEDWQCIDLGNMVLHLMLEETRKEYELEKLWVLGPHHDDLMLEKPSEEEVIKRLSMQGLNLMSMTEDSIAEMSGAYPDIDPWDDLDGEELFAEGKMGLTTEDFRKEEDELDDDDAFLV